MSNKKSFLQHFWQQRKKIGAVKPSSKYLASKMLSPIDFKNAKTIVEFGPGTGVFTRKIVQNMNPNTNLYVFELHKPFFAQLKEEFKNHTNVHIIFDSADKLEQHINSSENQNVDYVISSLPLANFNKSLVKSILETSRKMLKKNGYYIQFQYSLKSKRLLNSFFNDIDVKFTSRNIPPAFVYICKKK